MKYYLKFLLLFILLNSGARAFADGEVQPVNPLEKQFEQDAMAMEDKKVVDKEVQHPSDQGSENAKLCDGIPLKSGNGERIKWHQGDYTLGCHHVRHQLEDHGIALGVTYFSEPFLKVSGGLTNHAKVKYMGLVDFSAAFDTEKLGLWPGGTAYISGQNLHGQGLTSNKIGDIQTISNIDAPNFTKLNEFWYEQVFLQDRFKIKLGKQDANADFSTADAWVNYINSSFALNPTIPMPTYPDPALSVVASAKIYKGITLKGGVYDGSGTPGQFGFKTAFDGKGGTFIIVEPSLEYALKNMPGKYMIGYWHHTGNVEEITLNPSPKTYHSTFGFYTGFSQMIFKEIGDVEDLQGLTLLGQFGYAPDNRSEVARFYGAGLSYQGLIPHRDEDFTGIGVVMADLSHRLKITESKTMETALEIFYRIHVTPFLDI